jgi:phenylacetate-CoA ligase
LTAYELCSELHRRRIREAFECPVFGVYGATEFGALALQCEAGRYHVNPESYIVELQPVAGAVGELLVTSLDKKVMPLLRYRTGDLAIAADGPCSCAWSETGTLASLEGRMADAISRADGERVTVGAVDRAVASATDEVVTYCVVQTGRGYRFEYLPAEGFGGGSIDRVVEALRELFGGEVRAERRRELLPAGSGKFRLCVGRARAAE